MGGVFLCTGYQLSSTMSSIEEDVLTRYNIGSGLVLVTVFEDTAHLFYVLLILHLPSVPVFCISTTARQISFVL